MAKIAILGGAFDPPQLGHVSAAKFVLKNFPQIDAVRLMPTYRHPYGKRMASYRNRIKMCKLALKEYADGLPISVAEDESTPHLVQKQGKTYDLMAYLVKKNPLNKYYCIIGMDNANTIEQWYKYEELRQMIPFIVVSRGGCPAFEEHPWYMNSPHLFIEDTEGKIPAWSSTIARDVLSACWTGDYDPTKLNEIVGKDVKHFIFKNNLYRK
jgi:nicotinate-nucleotide adenylyltransferase